MANRRIDSDPATRPQKTAVTAEPSPQQFEQAGESRSAQLHRSSLRRPRTV